MIQGSIVALITPMQKDGKIDFSALKKLLKWHLELGTDGLVLCGTTGEGHLIDTQEKLLIFETAKKVIGNKIPLIAATGTCSTKESVFLTQEAKRLQMDACLAIVPYYVRPSLDGCFAHFAQIATASLPIILYHHPKRTGIKLSKHDLERILTIPGIVGIKDATDDLSLSMNLAQKIPHFSGNDLLTLPQFSVGFIGSISVIGNLFPKQWKEYIHLALAHRLEEARRLFFHLRRFCEILNLETNPICIKYAMSLVGKCLPYYRLPLCLPREENKRIIAELFESELHPRLLDEFSNQTSPASLMGSS